MRAYKQKDSQVDLLTSCKGIPHNNAFVAIPSSVIAMFVVVTVDIELGELPGDSPYYILFLPCCFVNLYLWGVNLRY